MNADALHALANAWLAAFNTQDLDSLLNLYAEDAVHTSPKLRTLHPRTGGQLQGRPALRAWWEDSFRRLPGLRYELVRLTAEDDRVFFEYLRHLPGEPPMPVAEVLQTRGGKIVASAVYHG